MAIRIIVEGVLLGALLALFCAVGIRGGAVNMVFLYHRDVQDRCVENGLITREKIRRNRRLFKGLGIPLYFAFVLVSVYAVNGARGAWPGFQRLYGQRRQGRLARILADVRDPFDREPDRPAVDRRILGGAHKSLGDSRHSGHEAVYKPERQNREMADGNGRLCNPLRDAVRDNGAGDGMKRR